MSTESADSQKDTELADIDDLLEVTRSCIQEWGALEFPYRVATEYDKTFRVGLPLAAHALNSAKVAIDAWSPLPWVAAANARVAFEHAFVAQWVFLTPDGPEHFMRHVAHSNLVQAQDFARAIADQPELTAMVPDCDLTDFQSYADREPVPGSERSWNLQSLFSRFESSGLLYGSYRSLSSAVHPSTGTIAAHLDLNHEGTPRLQRAGQGATNRYEPAQGLALAALWALNFIDKCAPSYAEPGRAGTIGIPNGLPYDLSHSDQR